MKKVFARIALYSILIATLLLMSGSLANPTKVTANYCDEYITYYDSQYSVVVGREFLSACKESYLDGERSSYARYRTNCYAWCE